MVFRQLPDSDVTRIKSYTGTTCNTAEKNCQNVVAFYQMAFV